MEKKNRFIGCLNAKAFTLIELLVVVLIIGILAAIALPQYRKAVERARTAQLVSSARALHQGISAWILANGIQEADFLRDDELDVDIKPSFTCSVDDPGYYCTNGFHEVRAYCYPFICRVTWSRASGDEWWSGGSIETFDGRTWRASQMYRTELGRVSCEMMASVFGGECDEFVEPK